MYIICNVSDVNECLSIVCQFGGTCNNLLNDYTCSCSPGYTGRNCETGLLIVFELALQICNANSDARFTKYVLSPLI